MTHQEVEKSLQAKPRLYYGYIVVASAFFIMVVMYGTWSSFGVFFKPLLNEFGWTRAMTSGAYSISALLNGFFAIFAGRLNDRFGPKVLVIVCGLLFGLAYLLMSRINNIWQLYLFNGVIIGVGLSCHYVPLVSTVARWFAKSRGLMTGIATAGMGFGTMTIPPITSRLIATYSWQTSYVIIGIMALVLIIIAAQFLRREPSQIGQLQDGGDELKQKILNLDARGFSLQEAFHTSQFWSLFIVFLCFSVSVHTIMVHIVPHATDLGISATSAANILAIFGGVSITSRIIIGGPGDRVGIKPAILASFILMSIALLYLLLAKQIWMFYLFAAIFGFGFGGMAALQSPITADLFGLSSHGVILGVISFGSFLGGATGPVIAGGIFDMTGSYQVVFSILFILAIITLILLTTLRPTASRQGTK